MQLTNVYNCSSREFNVWQRERAHTHTQVEMYIVLEKGSVETANVAQLVGCKPDTCEALSLVPSTT